MVRRAKKEKPLPNPGGDVEEARKRTLAKINEKMEELGLQPFRRLGDIKEGEEEIEGIASWFGHDYVTVVVFNVVYPDGNHSQHAIVYNTRQVPYRAERRGQAVDIHLGGAICIVTLRDQHGTDHFVLARQYRLASEEWDPWPLDIPRGFIQGDILPMGVPIFKRDAMPFALDANNAGIAQVPISVVGRKLAPLFASKLVRTESFSVLGISPQNTGTDRVLNLVTHMGLVTDDIESVLKVRGPRAMRLEYPTVEEVYDRWYEMGMSGEQTTTALWFYDRMVRNKKSKGGDP